MKSALVLTMLLVASNLARAQTIIVNQPSPGNRILVKGQKVTVAITLSSPVSPTDVATEWSGQLGDANQSLYKIVGAECAVLSAVLKGNCKLVQIATTGNINDRNVFGNAQAGTGTLAVNANATFEIDPPSTPAPAPR